VQTSLVAFCGSEVLQVNVGNRTAEVFEVSRSARARRRRFPADRDSGLEPGAKRFEKGVRKQIFGAG
jgi:hypothetical protein